MFDLTPEQVEKLAPLFAQLEVNNLRGEHGSMVIAQVWHHENGYTASVALIPEAKAVLMKAALMADGGLIVRVDRTNPEGP